MKISEAKKSDFASILHLIQKVARWLKQEQVQQWAEFLTGDGPQLLEKRFEEGEVYIAEEGRRLVGVLVLQWEDGFWGAKGLDDLAGYVHTMAVDREFAGKGVGAALMAKAELRCAEQGRRYVRLDCSKDNTKLCAYYERHGFKSTGTKSFEDWILNLYEKDLGAE